MSDSGSSKSSKSEKGEGSDAGNGNRDNFVNTTCRVCPANGYKRGTIYVDNEFNEVQLISQPPKGRPDSWVLDDSLDDIPSPQKIRDYDKLRRGSGSADQQPTDSFANQQQTFEKFLDHAEKRFSLRTKAVTVVALGGTGSGKTYTLFGGSNHVSRGLAPRTLEYLFDDASCSLKVTHVLLSFYLVEGEMLQDLLNEPSTRHSHLANVAYSKALGPLPLPIQPVCVQSSKQGQVALALGLQTAAVLLATRAEYFISTSIVCTFTCTSSSDSSQIVTRISFVEAPSLAGVIQLPSAVDRLTGTSLQYAAARALNSIGKARKKRAGGEETYAGTPAQKHFSEYSKSVVTALLQDSLFKCPDVFMVGCLRGTFNCLEENFATLDLMNRIDIMSGALSEAEDMSGLTLAQTITSLDQEAIECAELSEQAASLAAEQAENAEAAALGLTREQFLKQREKDRLLAKVEAKGKLRVGKKEGADASEGTRRDKHAPPPNTFQPVPRAAALAHKCRALERLADSLRSIQAVGLGGSKSAAAEVEVVFNLRIPSELPFNTMQIEPQQKLSDDETASSVPEPQQLLQNAVVSGKLKRPPQPQPNTPGQPMSSKERKARQDRFAALKGAARWIDPRATVRFEETAAAWLRLHGLSVPYVGETILLQGAEFKAAQQKKVALEARMAEHELLGPGSGNGETLGLTFATPWAQKCEDLDSYLHLLSPASGLAEHFTKVSLPLGQCLIRGQTHSQSVCISRVSSSNQMPPDSKRFPPPPRIERSDNLAIDPTQDPELGRTTCFSMSPVDSDRDRDRKNFELALDTAIGNFLVPNADDRASRTAKEGASFKQILLPGPGVDVLHAVFTTAGSSVVRVRPMFTISVGGHKQYSLVAVNGQVITDEVSLQDQDVVQIGHARFVQLRIPSAHLSFKKTGGSLGDERRSDLTLWEWSLIKAFSRQLRQSVERAERTRRHTLHLDVNRELVAVTKTAEQTGPMRMQNFDPPVQIVAAVYAAISAYDRAYLCSLIGAASLITYWSGAMRRGASAEFHLQAISPKDIQYKGRVVKVGAHVIAAAAAAAVGVNEDDLKTSSAARKEFRNDYERREHEKLMQEQKEAVAEEEEEEEAMLLPQFGQAQPRRRLALLRTVRGQQDGAESAIEDRLYCGQLLFVGSVGGQCWWAAPVLIERLSLASLMFMDFQSAWCGRDTSFLDALYPPARDCFQDTVVDELIGVGFVYLDPVQYLLDIDDCVPLTNMAGLRVGALRVRGRTWIDKVEPSPSYLSVDKERLIDEFMGKTCVLRLFFEYLQDLPPALCASTFVNFKFFYHSKPYRTARHGGASVNPYLNSVLRIDQKITADFIEFVKRGCLELEVFGKRREPPASVGIMWSEGYWPLQVGDFVEPYIPPAPEGGAADEEFNNAVAEDENLVENMKKEMEDLAADLQAAERQLLRATKITDASHEDNQKLHKTIEKHLHRHAELEADVAKHKKIIEDMKMKNNKSKVCVIA